MKIAIIIDSLAIGGAQKHVRQLACGLVERKHFVSVFSLNPIIEPLYQETMERSGVKTMGVGRFQTITGIGLARVTHFLWSESFEIVITVLFVSTVFGRIAAQLAGGLPVLTSLQARNLNYRFWQNLFLRATCSLSDFTISNSRSALPWAWSTEGIEPRKSLFLPNIVEPPTLKKAPPPWASIGLALSKDHFVIGSLGRLEPQKGYDILLRAIAMLSTEKRARVRVVIFGEGSQRAELERLKSVLNLDQEVFLPGQRADAVDYLGLLSLYIQPSRFEGTPNALVEALNAGVPTIGAAVDGILEIHSATEAFELFPVADHGKLFEQIDAHMVTSAPAPRKAVRLTSLTMPNQTLPAFDSIISYLGRVFGRPTSNVVV